VRKTGKPAVLRPMNSKERWIVHNFIKGMEGLRSESVGEGRMRRVKIEPE
jgi:predicted RNA-binding protein Jag